MNATIEAAWIAAGVGAVGIVSTTIVAIVSTVSSRRASHETLQAAADNLERTLDAARADRLWDAQASAYTDAIRLIRHRVLVRAERTRPLKYDAETEKRVQDWLASIKLPEWLEVEARLMAFASPQVLEAAEVSGKSSTEAERLYESYETLSDQARKAAAAGLPQSVPDGDAVIDARNAAMAAVEAASVKADELFEVIRENLHSKPSQNTGQRRVALPPASEWRGLMEPP